MQIHLLSKVDQTELTRMMAVLKQAKCRVNFVVSKQILSIVAPQSVDVNGILLPFQHLIDFTEPIDVEYKLASRQFKPERTTFTIGDVTIGEELVVIAGPCAVETEATFYETARAVKRAGANIIRGGAFKPRTSPYSFQGLGEPGLKLLEQIGKELNMPVITEVIDTRDVELVAGYSDIIQIGSRNMQNYALIKEVGKTNRPILLKRGLMSTIDEWLLAAEYLLSAGNERVMLCERGVRTFDDHTRNILDIAAVPLVHLLSHLPVLVDPSHASGDWRLVEPLAKAAVAVGCDGLMIEVHTKPSEAWSDGKQSLNINGFASLVLEIRG